jgi:1-acyl-sn-glycerol-3-phosphate acyltransferase
MECSSWTMTASERALVEALGSEGGYRTPDAKARWRLPGRKLLGTWRFHLRVFGIYLRANRHVARGRFGNEAYARQAWDILRIAESAGARVQVRGLHPIARSNGPVVVVGNHMSSLETLLVPGFLLPFRTVAFVVKASLERHPVFGPIMRAVPRVTVGRTNPRDDLHQVLTQGKAHLERGVSVVIFPQATRRVEFDVAAFNTLGVKLAGRAGVPVVPLALKTDFFANGRWIKDVGMIDPDRGVFFEFGAPLRVEGNGRATHAAVVRHIGAHLQAWGGKVIGEQHDA